MTTNGLESIINEPTRITIESQTCIDHVFVRVSNKNKIKVDAGVEHLNITDHSLVRVTITVAGSERGQGSRGAGTADPTCPPAAYRIDYATLNCLLDNADWAHVYQQQNASDAYDLFLDSFLNYILKSKVEVRKKVINNKLKPWISDFICMKIKIRNRIFRNLKKHPNNIKLKIYFKKYRNKLNEEIKALKNTYYKKAFDDCNGNSKAIWNLVNDITGQQCKKGNELISLTINDQDVNDPEIVSNEFNKYFCQLLNK